VRPSLGHIESTDLQLQQAGPSETADIVEPMVRLSLEMTETDVPMRPVATSETIETVAEQVSHSVPDTIAHQNWPTTDNQAANIVSLWNAAFIEFGLHGIDGFEVAKNLVLSWAASLGYRFVVGETNKRHYGTYRQFKCRAPGNYNCKARFAMREKNNAAPEIGNIIFGHRHI
jgi:hypothetical protein